MTKNARVNIPKIKATKKLVYKSPAFGFLCIKDKSQIGAAVKTVIFHNIPKKKYNNTFYALEWVSVTAQKYEGQESHIP